MSDPARFLLRHDRAVQAGAGTGKTHALVTQYLHLCAGLTAHGRPLEPRQIAALTFTEKAAGEMLERLRQRTARLCRAMSQGSAAERQEALGAAEPDLLCSAQLLGLPLPGQEHWERILVQLGGAPVGTFHSFAGGLLRRHAAPAGVDPDFVLLDEETAHDMELDATERVVLLALEGRLTEGAGDPAGAEPAGASVSPHEAALLVAEYGFRGVGGGNAVVEALCQVRRKRAEEGLSPAGLAAAYSDEATAVGFALVRDDLLLGLSRLAELAPLLGGKSSELARELAGERAALQAALRSFDGISDALLRCQALHTGLGRLRGKKDDESAKSALAAAKALIRGAIEDLPSIQRTVTAAPLARTFERLLTACWAAYDEAKRRAFGLDFTDLLYRARDLLRDHAEVQKTVQARFAAVLVDEFQDTNPLQGELLVLVAGAPDQRRDGPGKLYIVGDRKQSIYEFRGADVATFTALRAAIVAAGGDEEALTVSRRSLPGVLNLVNALFARVMQPPDAAAGAVQRAAFDESVSSPPDWIIRWDPARDPLLPLRQNDAEPPAPAAELLRAAPPADDQPPPDPIAAEADITARHIVALHRAGRRFGDMAVLLRRFTHLDRYLLALRRAGIPHYVVKGRGFYNAQEIRDLCAALTLLDDPDDLLALISVLRSPLCGLSDDSLVRLHLGGKLTLPALVADVSGLEHDEADRLSHLLRLIAALLFHGDRLGPAACLRALCDTTDLPAVLAAGPEGEQRVANLEMLLSRAQRFEETGGGLRAFVRWLRLSCDPALAGDALAPQAQIVDERDDVVRVMTVHQAKGLEFPLVIIPGCAARERNEFAAISYDRDIGLGMSLRQGGERGDTLPSLRVARLRQQRAAAESARLFYVATTRARDQVAFAGEVRRGGFGGTWRGFLESLLASPDGAALTAVEFPPHAAVTEEAGDSTPADAVQGARILPEDPAQQRALALFAATAVARAYHAGAASAALSSTGNGTVTGVAGPLCLTVSAACDLAVCRARYHFLHVLRLQEQHHPSESPARGQASDEDDGSLAVGKSDLAAHLSLAHRLLSRADFTAQGTDLEGLLLADGHDPALPAVAEIRTRVARLLRSGFGHDLAAAAQAGPDLVLRRALPFLLRLPGPGPLQCRLRGQLDLVVIDTSQRAGSGEVTAIDYHYSYAPPDEDGPLQTLRRGILGHAARALCPAAARVRTGFAYLREPDPTPRLRDSLPRHEQAAQAALAAALPRVLDDPEDILRHPPLPQQQCAALGCGYRYRCHGERVP